MIRADAKALLESIARSFGYIYGRGAPCENQHNFSVAYAHHWQRCERHGVVDGLRQPHTASGNATADECANYCVVMFSDLTPQGYT